MLTIGVDARTYFFRAGLGRYCRAVLAAMMDARDDARFVVWLSDRKTPADFPIPAGPRLEVRVSAARFGDAALEGRTLAREADAAGVDVFFSPYSLAATPMTAPVVQTIHDLTAVLHPELHRADTAAYWRDSLPPAVRSAARIAVDSRATADELLALHPGAEGRTRVVPLAADADFSQPVPRDRAAALLAVRGLSPDRYVLFVGSLESRKNLPVAIDAYAGSSLAAAMPLVLAGTPRWGADSLAARIEAVDPPGAVLPLGFLPDEELRALYQNAFAFLYPSLYEGFGLPILEAMASGTAVVTSDRSSMREVAGDAALLADPTSARSIGLALDRLYADPSLRGILAGKGRARAASYSWARTGREMMTLCAEAAASPRIG
jgi:alpha-1,3-rhamnosyl/mannosyltransferase